MIQRGVINDSLSVFLRDRIGEGNRGQKRARVRMERMRKQIYAILNEIKLAVPYEPVEEAIERQKEDCDMCDEPEQLLGALSTLLKRKEAMIKEYQKTFENWQQDW